MGFIDRAIATFYLITCCRLMLLSLGKGGFSFLLDSPLSLQMRSLPRKMTYHQNYSHQTENSRSMIQ